MQLIKILCVKNTNSASLFNLGLLMCLTKYFESASIKMHSCIEGGATLGIQMFLTAIIPAKSVEKKTKISSTSSLEFLSSSCAISMMNYAYKSKYLYFLFWFYLSHNLKNHLFY